MRDERLIIFFRLFFVFCFLLSALRLNTDAATVRINPTKIRLIIPPGESASGVIEVENPSEEPLIVKAYLQDWAYTSLHDGTKEFFTAGLTPFSAVDWITISLPDFVIPSFGKQSINYTVKVPENAKGGHFAVLFFESLLGKSISKDTASLGVMVRMGALFYIEPEGTIIRSAEVSNFSVERTKDKSLAMSLDLKNTGNVDITCKGTFHIIDKQGLVLARAEFNDTYTFAAETAKLAGVWKDPLPKGKYDLVFTLDIGKALEELNLGRGPVITKETEIEIGEDGKIEKVGRLR